MWTLYQLRIRQVARALNARFDERLAERTRVAREIHDTLLQTVQGSKMVAEHALTRPDDTDGMRHAMERVSTWLGQASAEGRAAISALRASTTETNDLAEALRRAIEDCRRQASIDATLSVVGTAREMHPVVRDEMYRMAYEAIRNACTHSGGTRLDVGLTYGQDLAVRVSDNGVGIDPAIVDAGKDGHFGLRGMRERATRIGAKLTITSAANAGTEIVIAVPGRVIFRKN
jgi:signal transduction histidine kinase